MSDTTVNGLAGNIAGGQCASTPDLTVGEVIRKEEKRLMAQLSELEALRAKLPASILEMKARELSKLIGRIY